MKVNGDDDDDDDDDCLLTILLFIIISSTRFPQTLSSSTRFRRPYDSSSISIDDSSISIGDSSIIVLVLVIRGPFSNSNENTLCCL